MDTVHNFLNQRKDSYIKDSLDGLISFVYGNIGWEWIQDTENPWDVVIVCYMELEIRSALEFIRQELTEEQRAILDEWDKTYREWIKQGIFYERYAEASGGRFRWKDTREEAKELLGRAIPPSHFWFWPPDEAERR